MHPPRYCLICNEGILQGGHCDEDMEVGKRNFYACGSSISVKSEIDGAYTVLIKNCCKQIRGK